VLVLRWMVAVLGRFEVCVAWGTVAGEALDTRLVWGMFG
jgi:hypothetical protein